MKKFRVLLIFLLMTLFVDVLASSPAKLKDYGPSSVKQGDVIIIDTKVVSGNILGYQNVEFNYSYDPQVLEFVSFETNYGFNYDSNTMVVTKDSKLELDSYVQNEDNAVTIWTMTFRVKDYVKVGTTTINGNTYSITEKEDIGEEIVVEDENGVESDKNINIFIITTIVLGAISLIELVFILINKNKKA